MISTHSNDYITWNMNIYFLHLALYLAWKGVIVYRNIFNHKMCICAHTDQNTCISTYSPPKYASISFWLCVRAKDWADYIECTLIHLSHCVCVPICMNVCVGVQDRKCKGWGSSLETKAPTSPHEPFPFIGAWSSCPHYCNAWEEHPGAATPTFPFTFYRSPDL